MASPIRRLSGLNRVMAGVLAMIWTGAGIVAVILGAKAGRWGTVALGALAVCFGVIWGQVARTGRYWVWPSKGRK